MNPVYQLTKILQMCEAGCLFQSSVGERCSTARELSSVYLYWWAYIQNRNGDRFNHTVVFLQVVIFLSWSRLDCSMATKYSKVWQLATTKVYFPVTLHAQFCSMVFCLRGPQWWRNLLIPTCITLNTLVDYQYKLRLKHLPGNHFHSLVYFGRREGHSKSDVSVSGKYN